MGSRWRSTAHCFAFMMTALGEMVGQTDIGIPRVAHRCHGALLRCCPCSQSHRVDVPGGRAPLCHGQRSQCAVNFTIQQRRKLYACVSGLREYDFPSAVIVHKSVSGCTVACRLESRCCLILLKRMTNRTPQTQHALDNLFCPSLSAILLQPWLCLPS